MDKIFELVKKEEVRQSETLMMIPSENYTYPEVRKAVGSILMHKYAEGQPQKRYYQGNRIMDEIESLCEKRALEAFGLNSKKWFANVQPHSGSPANLAVYSALLQVGDKIMSMYLPDGGHLSHGWYLQVETGMRPKKVSFTSKVYNVEFYYVEPKTRVFDYGQIEAQALKVKPKLIISGGTAYAREINHRRMSQIAKKVGAYYLADIAHEAGLIAAGANKSPFPYADVVTMTTHKTLRGPRGAIIVGKKKFEEAIDFAVFPGLQGGPHMHTIAGIAIALDKTRTKPFKDYAYQTVKNAKFLADFLLKKGLDVVSGGTDKHLMLIDLRQSGTNGWIVGEALEAAGIVANRNTVPLEDASPFYPSGLRLGTPAVTVRGMKEGEMKKIGNWIYKVIEYIKDEKIPEDKKKRLKYKKEFRRKISKDEFLLEIAKEVKGLCKKFPVP
jgi:glycine hydroxymethyltransferase